MSRLTSLFFAVLVIVTIDQTTAPKPGPRPKNKETQDPIHEGSDPGNSPLDFIDEIIHQRQLEENKKADISPWEHGYSSAEFGQSSRSVVENPEKADKAVDNHPNFLPESRSREIGEIDVKKSPKTEIITQKIDEVSDKSHSPAITSKTFPKKNTEESLRSFHNNNDGSSAFNEKTANLYDQSKLLNIDTIKNTQVEVQDIMGNKYFCKTGFAVTDSGVMKFIEFSDEIQREFVRSGKESVFLRFEDGSPFNWDVRRSQFFDMKEKTETVYLFDESNNPVLCRTVYEKTETGVRRLIELSDEAQKRFLAAGKYGVILRYSSGELSYWDLTASRYHKKGEKDVQNVISNSKKGKKSKKSDFSVKNYLLKKKNEESQTSSVFKEHKMADQGVNYVLDPLSKFRPWEVEKIVVKSPKTDIITHKIDQVSDEAHSSAISSETVPKKNTGESLRSVNDNAESSTFNENGNPILPNIDYIHQSKFDDLGTKSSIDEPKRKVQKTSHSDVSSTNTIDESIKNFPNLLKLSSGTSIAQSGEYEKVILHDENGFPVPSFLLKTSRGIKSDYLLSDSTQLYYIRKGYKKVKLYDAEGSAYEWDLEKSSYYELRQSSGLVNLYDKDGNTVTCRIVYRKNGHIIEKLFELSDESQKQLIKSGENIVVLSDRDGHFYEVNTRNSYYYDQLEKSKRLGSPQN